MAEPAYDVAIIGAGPGGIAAAHLLRKKGITDFVILERDNEFGGTWRDNHYPGLAVDIPTLWYQLSFAPTPTGPDSSPRDPRSTATCGTPPASWPIRVLTGQCRGNTTEVGRHHGRVAPGDQEPAGCDGAIRDQLDRRVRQRQEFRRYRRVDDFEGTVLRPNAWDDTYDACGKRIAVIGTGSGGVQIAAALSAEARTWTSTSGQRRGCCPRSTSTFHRCCARCFACPES